MQTPSPELLRLQQAVAGRFAVERELGRGGMGMVFLAHELALDRPVAIKLLAPSLAQVGGFRSRFLAEARTAARLAHPHIVPIHAVEESGDLVYIVMGYVEGETLGERVRRGGPLGRAEAARVFRELAWALGHAHALGVIHRDVKPDNILLERQTGRALVSDFGIAQPAGTDDGAEGNRLGTPHYMSPERIEGRPADRSGDLYALGVTMYFALAGRLPFEGSARDVLVAHLHQEPPPLPTIRPDLPRRFVDIVERCLQKNPSERFASAEAFLEALGGASLAMAQAPLPLAAFARDARAVAGDIGAAWLAAGIALLIHATVFSADLYAAMVFYPIAALLTGVGLVRFGELVLRARTLLQQGYSQAALRPAVLAEQRREEEEIALAHRAPQGWMDRPGPLALVGALKTAAAVWLATTQNDTLILIGVVGAILIPTAFLRRLWRTSPGARGLWSRLLAGRFGRALFRLAGAFSRRREVPPPVDAPTAILLGDAAERLFQALPAEQRRLLGDVPSVLSRLQAEALRDNGPGPGGAAAVTALEAIRLDLLRLQAGGGHTGELTRDLEAARRLGEAVDARLADR